jgi:hypothetical protein
MGNTRENSGVNLDGDGLIAVLVIAVGFGKT